MRAKSLILLVIALGCGMIAAVGVSKAIMDKPPTEAAEAMAEIFVAVKDLPHAQKISPESVKLEKWPRSRLPEGAVTVLQQVEGKFTNQMIFAGEPILERKLADSRESFSTTIPPGYRIFDIPGSAGYIKPGDHVDILGTFNPGGRGSVAETRTVMRNVQVFGIDGVTKRDSESSNASNRGSVFQLLVKESQLEALTLANTMSELRMNLRPFGETTAEGADNGESFLSWVQESEKQPEPARQELVSAVSNSVQSIFGASPVIATEPAHEMVIITPAGMKKYQWTQETELPKEVVDQPNGGMESPYGGKLSNGNNSASGNVYSGYGGYTPTYPTSLVPQPPVDAPQTKGASKSPVN